MRPPPAGPCTSGCPRARCSLSPSHPQERTRSGPSEAEATAGTQAWGLAPHQAAAGTARQRGLSLSSCPEARVLAPVPPAPAPQGSPGERLHRLPSRSLGVPSEAPGGSPCPQRPGLTPLIPVLVLFSSSRNFNLPPPPPFALLPLPPPSGCFLSDSW